MEPPDRGKVAQNEVSGVSKGQKAKGKRQKAKGKRQKAKGKRQGGTLEEAGVI